MPSSGLEAFVHRTKRNESSSVVHFDTVHLRRPMRSSRSSPTHSCRPVNREKVQRVDDIISYSRLVDHGTHKPSTLLRKSSR